MCYAAPGPRCSAHARKDLERAAATVARVQADLDGERDRGPSQIAGHRVLLDRLQSAEKRFFRAEAEYQATPAGISELKAQAAELAERLGEGAEQSPYYQSLAEKIRNGQRRRAEQLAAYTATQGVPLQPQTHSEYEDEVDTPEDEAAAAAPICACITFRYKGTCAHLGDRSTVEQQALVPSTLQASERLHAANERAREAHRHYIQVSRLGAPGGGRDDAVIDRAHREYLAAQQAVQDAEMVFYGTPGGQAYLERKISRSRWQNGSPIGHATGTLTVLEDRLGKAVRARADRAAEFTAVTGQRPPVESPDAIAPPTGLGACSCEDGRWTGACVHTSDTPERTEQLRAAYAAEQERAEQKTRRRGWFWRR